MRSLAASKSATRSGFTLIELSIVLVIIGLLAGGVLVGQDLIRAAEVRATISQIEKFNTAKNTFYGKYQALPGDMNYSTAMTFGFALSGRTSANNAGEGDGNGLLEGGFSGAVNQYGETGTFWVDLSSSTAGNLIAGGFNMASEAATGSYVTSGVSVTALPQYFPAAKLGRGNYIYVYSYNGVNYYGLSNISALTVGAFITSSGSLSPAQAYNIDKKIDDGFPNSGNVTAYYLATMGVISASTNASPGVAGDCWDSTGATSGNGSPPITIIYTMSGQTLNGLSGSPGFYMTTVNNGEGTGCALSFKFQ